MGGKASRDKGYRFEREVVQWFLSNAISAYRVDLSGGGGAKDDVVIGDSPMSVSLDDLRIEAKRRKKIPTYFHEWLSGSGLAVLRGDRGERVWLMTDAVFLKLVQAYETLRRPKGDALTQAWRIVGRVVQEKRRALASRNALLRKRAGMLEEPTPTP